MAAKTAEKTETPAKAPSAKKEKGKKKGKKLFLLILVVLLLGGGAGGYLMLSSAKRPQGKVSLPPVTFSVPQITTNLDDGHLIQVSMILVLDPGDSTALVRADLDQLENAAILAFGSMSFGQLSPSSGRVAAQQVLANTFNAVLHHGKKPWDTVTGVEFTNFILQ